MTRSPKHTLSRPNPRVDYPEWFIFIPFLALAFALRLAFGLCSNIWFIDQHQIYLIGLKYYTTGLWPYFGPDVSGNIQLPGALQGLVIGLPLRLWPIPESPYVFLNLLSFAGLCLLAWYCSRRLPRFPRWILWTWLLSAPWVLNWSTNIDNDSYVLFGSCLFFVGFLETLPPLTLNLIPFGLANYWMGFALGWDAQFHMSFVILFPFIFVSLAWQLFGKSFSASKKIFIFISFLLGALTTYSLVIPTWIHYGFSNGSGNTLHAIAFDPKNFYSFFTVLFRFLALACCEIPRFIGANSSDRLMFLRQNEWLAPFTIVSALLGLSQLSILTLSLFRKRHPQKDWPSIKRLAFLTFILIYVSFIFAIKAPAAHTYYLTLPIAMIYGFYALSPFAQKPWFSRWAIVLLTCNLIFHAGLAIDSLPVKSLYKNRALFSQAIQTRNYHLLGERRPHTRY